MVISALALPIVLGMGALAVDVGYLYTARNQMQNAADAAAIAGAQVMLNGGDTSAATTAAVNYSNQNAGNVSYLTGATTTVSFPAANTVQANIAHNSVGLFFANLLGINHGQCDRDRHGSVWTDCHCACGRISSFSHLLQQRKWLCW